MLIVGEVDHGEVGVFHARVDAAGEGIGDLQRAQRLLQGRFAGGNVLHLHAAKIQCKDAGGLLKLVRSDVQAVLCLLLEPALQQGTDAADRLGGLIGGGAGGEGGLAAGQGGIVQPAAEGGAVLHAQVERSLPVGILQGNRLSHAHQLQLLNLLQQLVQFGLLSLLVRFLLRLTDGQLLGAIVLGDGDLRGCDGRFWSKGCLLLICIFLLIRVLFILIFIFGLGIFLFRLGRLRLIDRRFGLLVLLRLRGCFPGRVLQCLLCIIPGKIYLQNKSGKEHGKADQDNGCDKGRDQNDLFAIHKPSSLKKFNPFSGYYKICQVSI